jgi:hypothetical protein
MMTVYLLMNFCPLWIYRRSKQQGGIGVALPMVAADDTVHGVCLSAVHDLRGVFRSDRTQCQSEYITS